MTEDTVTFADELPQEAASDAPPWIVLVADDDPEVHVTTEFALRDVTLEGRGLRFLHAYSAAQARGMVQQEPDLAVLILDVVMESERAGLDLVRVIREELGRGELRIMLRTGQPGYAPEVDTIRQLDINDYKTKTELTRTRLFASLTVAVRSYRQLTELSATRRALEHIITAGVDLAGHSTLGAYAHGVVSHLCALLGVPPEGLVCACGPEPGSEPVVLAACGRHGDAPGRPLARLADPALATLLRQTLAQRASRTDSTLCLHFAAKDGTGIVVHVATPAPLDGMARKLVEIFSTNIAAGFDSVLMTARITELAYEDRLVHLANRNRFAEWLQEPATLSLSVALIDIDDFAGVNTILDHEFGDAVLVAVAQRLTRLFPAPARVARIGTDIFGIVAAPELISDAAIAHVFALPFDIQGHELRLSATAGIYIATEPGKASMDILRDVGAALKQAKAFARGKAVHFDASLSTRARERMLLLSNLRTAFSEERLFLAYQPVVNLKTRRVTGCEALLRWVNAEGQFVPPDRFIPLAEESGLMVHIGQWVVRTALQMLKAINDGGQPGFRMAVNVSQVQFFDPGFLAGFEKALRASGVNPRNLEIELTESVAIKDVDFIVGTLERLRALGVSVAIDDFGTGYSSLSIVGKLPLNRMKIDKSFVQAMQVSKGSIPPLIVNLAKQLGLETLAEGVETEAQAEALLALGCEEAQGYLFAKPLRDVDLKGFLAAQASP